MKDKSGLIGSGIIGCNLLLNPERSGNPIACHDRDANRNTAFMTKPYAGDHLTGLNSHPTLMTALKKLFLLNVTLDGDPRDHWIDQQVVSTWIG
jgi:6-phosphogluconate dehydrogenase